MSVCCTLDMGTSHAAVTAALVLPCMCRALCGHWRMLSACVQAVHELYDVTEGAAWDGNGMRSNRVVVIGCRLNRTELEEGLMQCVT